jgi:hypothetical protein
MTLRAYALTEQADCKFFFDNDFCLSHFLFLPTNAQAGWSPRLAIEDRIPWEAFGRTATW